jgi:hypothetical protein
MYLGDYAEDYATLNFKFTTRQSTGAPFTLGGSPVVSVYKANDLTQSTAGVTLAVDFDGVTGLNNVLIDLSADAFYAVANDYQVVITTGTVNSISVVGEVVGHFSIENRVGPSKTAAAVMTALNTDTFAEPGQGAPAATATLVAKLGYLYKAFRNRKTQTATVWSLYADDATTVDQKATVSDDGTTAEKTEIVTGP